MYAEQMLRKCGKCKIKKELKEFNRNIAHKNGYENYCRPCAKSKYYKKREYYLQKRKEYVKRNKEIISIQKNRAGATVEQFRELFKNQNGRCAICMIHQSEMKRRIAVDHCHKTNTIRGLLCDTCNRALGLLKDNIEVLESAISYLKKHLK